MNIVVKKKYTSIFKLKFTLLKPTPGLINITTLKFRFKTFQTNVITYLFKNMTAHRCFTSSTLSIKNIILATIFANR